MGLPRRRLSTWLVIRDGRDYVLWEVRIDGELVDFGVTPIDDEE